MRIHYWPLLALTLSLFGCFDSDNVLSNKAHGDFFDPAIAQAHIENISKTPHIKDGPVDIRYSAGVGHLDGLAPLPFHLFKVRDPDKHRTKWTFQNGRVVETAFFNNGEWEPQIFMWYAPNGLPILSRLGKYTYKVGLYDEANQIKAIYAYDKNYEVWHHETYEQDGDYLVSHHFNKKDGKRYESRWRLGEPDPEVKLPKYIRWRKNVLNMPVKYGLKPVYSID